MVKHQHLSTRQKILIAGGILVSLILVVGVAGMIYVQGLINLVDQGEVSGNPSLQESDLVDPDETVTMATTASANQGSETANGTSDPTASVTETTPLVTEKLIDVRSDPDVYNILLIGTDNRGDEINGRSDAMIIFSINKRTQKIHLVSLMRGLYVNIPGRGFSMLNHAFSFGGTKLLRQTIEANLRVRIDDFLLVDFGGFTQAIDVVGGVDINLTQAEAQYLNEQVSPALTTGVNRLNGEQSLAFARIRHLDTDYKRTGRQRKVIESLLARMSSQNPADLDAMVRQLLPLVKTNLSGSKMISLGLDLLKRKNYPVSQLMLPIDGTYQTIIVRNMEMVQFNFNKNIAALHKFIFED